MILTKDNIIRFISEKKAVTPTDVAEAFDTSTMIASAALSEVAKDKKIAITYLKLSSSPYYYDPKQSSVLIEIGKKHLSGYDKEVFELLQEKQIINNNSLNIQYGIAIERLKDFAKPLTVDSNNGEMKFWVWFQRNLDETKKQILDAINQDKNSNLKNNDSSLDNSTSNKNSSSNFNNKSNNNSNNNNNNKNNNNNNNSNNNKNDFNKGSNFEEKRQEKNTFENKNVPSFKPTENINDKVENYIENYLKNNYLKIESKKKNERGIEYNVELVINNMKIKIDCFYFSKKPQDSDIINFYTKGIKPKIIFVENAAKKIFKLAEDLENLTIVNI